VHCTASIELAECYTILLSDADSRCFLAAAARDLMMRAETCWTLEMRYSSWPKLARHHDDDDDVSASMAVSK
jgi:hypothetical protein